MLNLYTLNESFTSGLSYNFLYILFTFAILSSVFVIISKNPIVSVLFLIALFLNVATYLIMIGLNFIGLSYLLVYVGAVSILFLFILMLINVRISELVTDNSNSIPLAIIISILFNSVYYNLLPFSYNSYLDINEKNTMDVTYNVSNNIINDVVYSTFNQESNFIYFVTSQVWDGAIAETSHITSIGNVMYTVYPMWLLITSIILLLAMVGSIIITIKQ